MVAVSGEEDDAFDVLLVDAAEEVVQLPGGEVLVALAAATVGEHLAADADHFPGAVAEDEAFDEPLQLGFAEEGFGAFLLLVVGRPKAAVIEQEEIGIVVAESAGDAGAGELGDVLGAAARQRCPEEVEGFLGQVAVHPRAVGVVGAVVVVVPGGVVVGAGQEGLHLREAARVGVAVLVAGARVPVGLAQVHVIPQPNHHLRPLLGDAFEDAIFAAVPVAGPVISRFVHVGAATQGHGKTGRIPAPAPDGLGGELLAVGPADGLTVHENLVGVGLAGLHLVGHEVGNVGGALFGPYGSRPVGLAVAAGVLNVDVGGAGRLGPDHDLPLFAVAEHGSAPEGSLGADAGAEKEAKEKQTEGRTHGAKLVLGKPTVALWVTIKFDCSRSQVPSATTAVVRPSCNHQYTWGISRQKPQSSPTAFVIRRNPRPRQ